jgi:predicted small secreted protein
LNNGKNAPPVVIPQARTRRLSHTGKNKIYWRTITMKKAITLALVLVLALSLLTACGGKDNTGTGSTGGNNSTPGTSQGGNDTTPSNNGNNNVDLSTVAGFLSVFGLTEANIKPESAGVGDVSVSDDNYATGIEGRVSWYVENDTDELDNQWIKKAIAATKALSPDGKVYVSGTDLSEEFTFSSMETNTVQWEYRYKDNDKGVSVRCQVLDGGFIDFNIGMAP